MFNGQRMGTLEVLVLALKEDMFGLRRELYGFSKELYDEKGRVSDYEEVWGSLAKINRLETDNQKLKAIVAELCDYVYREDK